REEADLIVLNKCDLIDRDRSARLLETIAVQFPGAQIFEVSARHGTGLERWFEHMSSATQVPRAVMEVDYSAYAEGEARLGWLNCTVEFEAQAGLDGNRLIQALAREVQRKLNDSGAEVAHLKMTLDADNELGDLAVINLVRNDF